VRKQPRKKAIGPNWALISGIAMGMVGLVLGGFVVYKATRPKPTETTRPNSSDTAGSPGEPARSPSVNLTGLDPSPSKRPLEPLLPPEPPLPPGWMRVSAREVNLVAHLPGTLKEPEESESDMGGYRVENRQYVFELPGEGGGYELDVMILPAGATPNAEQETQFLRLPRHQIVRLAKGQVTAERVTTLAGAPATEFEFAAAGITGVYRYAFVRAGGKSLFVMAKAAGPKVGPAERQAFLDSVRPAGR
jgi:hypothetical protein